MSVQPGQQTYKDVKLTPITEDDEGLNNYNEFRIKAKFDLEAHGYWKYVDGNDYNPPVIPDLVLSHDVAGLDAAGNAATVRVPGNEVIVNVAKNNAASWLQVDKRVLAIIVKAVPVAKLYLVKDCQSAHAAWMKLKDEYEPANNLTAVTIKQQIINFNCGPGVDVVKWRKIMVELYGKLRDADPSMMPDEEFAKHLITLMTQDDQWRFCRDSLREKSREASLTGNALTSASVIQRFQQEEVEKGIDASVVQIHALVTGRSASRQTAVASVNAATPDGRKLDKSNQRRGGRPGPYNGQQRPRKICSNDYCETPLGHSKDDCFAYGGGKAGKYPPGFQGKKDVHLAPEARIAARRKQALQNAGGSGGFAGMTEVSTDKVVTELLEEIEEELEESSIGGVDAGFVFMADLPPDEDDNTSDDIAPDEFVRVNAVALNMEVAQEDTINHDTGASRHIFHRRCLFHDYVLFDTPLNVHGFGANLSAQAIGKGKIVMKATYDGQTRNFSISNALHIPTARCNLISGTRIDRKGVSTRTGNGRISYLNNADTPFAAGSIIKDLYKMDVETVEPTTVEPASGAPDASTPSLIAAMVPEVTSLFGPGVESEEVKKLGFITV